MAEGDKNAQVPEAGAKPPPEAPKPLWTSLEVAKLGISMLTPILIFSLGALLTYQNKAAEDAQRGRAAASEASAKAEALRRDDALRKEAIARDDKTRKEAFERDRQLREEGYARDQKLRDEAVARENALRRETERAAQLASLYARRTEFWEKFRPLIADVDSTISNLNADDKDQLGRIADAQTKLGQAEDLFEVYAPYFDNQQMRSVIASYRESLESLKTISQMPANASAMNMAKQILKAHYRTILRLGADVVATSTGFRASRDFR